MSQTHKAELEINMDQASLVDAGSASADFVVIRDKNSLYMTEQSTIAFLVFPLSGSPSSTTVKATSRYFYNTSSDSANYELDAEWSSDQWLKLDAASVTLTTDVSEATEFMLADANELIDVGNNNNADAKIGGITPGTLIFKGK